MILKKKILPPLKRITAILFRGYSFRIISPPRKNCHLKPESVQIILNNTDGNFYQGFLCFTRPHQNSASAWEAEKDTSYPDYLRKNLKRSYTGTLCPFRLWKW